MEQVLGVSFLYEDPDTGERESYGITIKFNPTDGVTIIDSNDVTFVPEV